MCCVISVWLRVYTAIYSQSFWLLQLGMDMEEAALGSFGRVNCLSTFGAVQPWWLGSFVLQG